MTIELPEAFKEEMKGLLGNEYDAFLASYEAPRYQAIRFNPCKKGMDAAAYDGVLSELGIEKDVVIWAQHAYYYNEERPGKHPYHEAGLYYIQEPSAMLPAAMLAPKPGMRVLDLCAAPGGKTTQLAGALAGQGLLVANEIHPVRAKILSQNVERFGVKNAIVTNEDSARLADHFSSFFHAILVDAPCSGEGMFRKNPQAIEEWSPDNVTLCAVRQREILDNAAQMLLPGGTLVYSTCTFSAAENEETIAAFLAKHEEFELLQSHRVWPHKERGEGHFCAMLKKAGAFAPAVMTEAVHAKKRRGGGALDKEKQKALQEFVEQTIADRDEADAIMQGRLTLFGEQLYLLPEETPPLEGIRVLRAGLHLGEFKKNRFEPSHALALTLGTEDVHCFVSVGADDARIAAFLRGESISLSGDEEAKGEKGWCLVAVNGFSAGWGKRAGMQIKNHYPKGLRRDLT